MQILRISKYSSCSTGKTRNEQKARTAQGPSPDCERLRAALNIAPSSKFGRAATRATTRAWTCILNHPTRRRHSHSKATFSPDSCIIVAQQTSHIRIRLPPISSRRRIACPQPPVVAPERQSWASRAIAALFATRSSLTAPWG
jgi:hypothetical protein